MAKKKTSDAPIAYMPLPKQALAKIVKRVPREETPVDLAKAGTYRVIHGTLAVPRPVEAFTNPDGSRKPHEPTCEYAIPGDEVELDVLDATNLLKLDIVEPLDAKPSRVGKVCPDPTQDPARRRNDPGRNIHAETNLRAVS